MGILKTLFFALGLIFAEFTYAAVNLAEEQRAYYHMHQAEEYLDLVQKGKCPVAQSQVDEHLRSANQIFDQVPDSPLEPLFRKLIVVRNAVVRGKNEAAARDLEKIRELTREVADHQTLTHQSKWHVEQAQACK